MFHRFGNETDLPPSNSLLKTIFIPSRTLETHNLEILVSSLRSGESSTGDASAVQDAIFVPTVETPTSASGRFSHVTYPVHKTIVLGENADSLIAYGRFTDAQQLPLDLVRIVVNVPTAAGEVKDAVGSTECIGVDVQRATTSLSEFRKTLIYQHSWDTSGIPSLSTWLFAGTKTENSSPLKPAIRHLVTSLLVSTARQVEFASAQAITSSLPSSTAEATKKELLPYISSWAEKSHTELRDQLDLAFASKHWARLKWWKLFWRVDDVSMIASEVIGRRWLIEAEKSLIFLAGRVTGAGIIDTSTSTTKEIQPDDEEKSAVRKVYKPTLDDLQKEDIMAADTGDATPLTTSNPWPLHITLTRHHLTQTTIPSLQALAQKLVLQTISTTSLTAAISALAYVSVTSTTLAEAGVVAAFGFVLSLRRMQSKWESAREYWEGELKEEGRVCLKETEEGVKDFVLKEGEAAGEDGMEESDRERAKEAILRSQEALKGLERKEIGT